MEMKLKKLLALLLVVCMCAFSFVACSDSDDDKDDDKKVEQEADDKDDDKDDADKDDSDKDDDKDDADKDDSDKDDDKDDADKDDADVDASNAFVGEWTCEINYAELLNDSIEGVNIETDLIIPLVWKINDDGTYTMGGDVDNMPTDDEVEAFVEAYTEAAFDYSLEMAGVTEAELEELLPTLGYDTIDDYIAEEIREGCQDEIDMQLELFGEEKAAEGTYEVDGLKIDFDGTDYIEFEEDGDDYVVVDTSDDMFMLMNCVFSK